MLRLQQVMLIDTNHAIENLLFAILLNGPATIDPSMVEGLAKLSRSILNSDLSSIRLKNRNQITAGKDSAVDIDFSIRVFRKP